MNARSAQRLPWWAGGGDVRCEACLQLFAYELECRCVVCDAGLCPHCTVSIREEFYCVGCQTVDEESD